MKKFEVLEAGSHIRPDQLHLKKAMEHLGIKLLPTKPMGWTPAIPGDQKVFVGKIATIVAINDPEAKKYKVWFREAIPVAYKPKKNEEEKPKEIPAVPSKVEEVLGEPDVVIPFNESPLEIETHVPVVTELVVDEPLGGGIEPLGGKVYGMVYSAQKIRADHLVTCVVDFVNKRIRCSQFEFKMPEMP